MMPGTLNAQMAGIIQRANSERTAAQIYFEQWDHLMKVVDGIQQYSRGLREVKTYEAVSKQQVIKQIADDLDSILMEKLHA
jgi:hypothetical protein